MFVKGAVDLIKLCYSKKLVKYNFRGHIWAYKKANEILFEIIYIYTVVYGCGFSIIQVKASKFTEKDLFKRTESQEEIQTA